MQFFSLDKYRIDKIEKKNSEVYGEYLHIKFKDSNEIKNTYYYTVKRINEKEYNLYINDINRQVGKIINYFMSYYKLKDFFIREPSLSKILCQIYEGKEKVLYEVYFLLEKPF